MNTSRLRTSLLVIFSLMSVPGLAMKNTAASTASTGVAGSNILVTSLGVGDQPGPLAAPGNSLYVASPSGSNHNVISLISPTGSVSTVHAFSPLVTDPITGEQTNADGWHVTSTVLGADGNLYGATVAGGSQGQGTLFSIKADGSFSTLDSFNFNITLPGAISSNFIVQGTDGAFYGIAATTTYNGYYVYYRVTANGQFTSLCQWTAGTTQVSSAPFSLQAGSDGSIYAVLGSSVVRLNPATCGFDPVYTDTSPLGPMVIGDGNFYVSTSTGLIKVSSAGIATRLLGLEEITAQVYKWGHWQLTDLGWVWDAGYWEAQGVAMSALGYGAVLYWGADGNLYASTEIQGLNGHGTLFRIGPDGTVNSSYASSNYLDGGGYGHPLVLGSDGKLRMTGYTIQGPNQGVSILETISFDSPLSTSISFSNPTVSLGQKTVLSWSSSGAASCQLISDIPFVAKAFAATSGSKAVHIYSTAKRSPASFTAGLQCTAPDGSVSNSAATVTVN